MADYRKYRSGTIRLKNWDYRNSAAYFVTICTKDRECYFGEIINGKMHLSNSGTIADVFWYEIRNHANYVELDAFVVMPNHMHGIVIINNQTRGTSVQEDEIQQQDKIQKNEYMACISPKPGSLSTIIRSYKSAVTKNCRRLGFPIEWQPRFYEHIIRDAKSFQTIQQYIINNPKNWREDRFSNRAYPNN